MAFILIFALSSAPQPSFVQGFATEAGCQRARADVVKGAGKNLRSAFCIRIGDQPTPAPATPSAAEPHKH